MTTFERRRQRALGHLDAALGEIELAIGAPNDGASARQIAEVGRAMLAVHSAKDALAKASRRLIDEDLGGSGDGLGINGGAQAGPEAAVRAPR